MRSHHYIQVTEIMVLFTLILKDVQPCPCDMPGTESRDERLRVHHRTARRIDEDRARFHLGQTVSIHEVLGGFVQRDMKGDGMALSQHVLQGHVLKAQLLGGCRILKHVVGDYAHPETLGDAGAVQPNAPRADHAEGLAVQLDSLQAAVGEEMFSLVAIVALDDVARDSQQQPKGMFGDHVRAIVRNVAYRLCRRRSAAARSM